MTDYDPLLELRDALAVVLSPSDPAVAVALLRDDLRSVARGGKASLRWRDRIMPACALAEIYEAMIMIEPMCLGASPELTELTDALRETVR